METTGCSFLTLGQDSVLTSLTKTQGQKLLIHQEMKGNMFWSWQNWMDDTETLCKGKIRTGPEADLTCLGNICGAFLLIAFSNKWCRASPVWNAFMADEKWTERNWSRLHRGLRRFACCSILALPNRWGREASNPAGTGSSVCLLSKFLCVHSCETERPKSSGKREQVAGECESRHTKAGWWQALRDTGSIFRLRKS